VQRSLSEKVVLITGAGTRVGRAIAQRIAQTGAWVAVHHHRSAEGARSLVETLGVSAAAFGADLTVDAERDSLVERVERDMGPIAALVNSAALFERAPFLETPDDVLDRQWSVNARAPFLLTRRVARGMVAQGGGDIVNIVDVGGVHSFWSNYSAYCMTKAALAALTRCLAVELAPAIRVNAVAPGTVLPPENLDEATRQTLQKRIPQRRFGTPEDVAEAVHFLLTGPTFITGQILAVDGGRSVGLAAGEG
jgi:NAD(P)-dependent dehydrogenase (short-subunit alcohol dehydrogenase family)